MRSFAVLALAAASLVACSSSPHDTGSGGSSGGGGGEAPTGPITGSVARYTYGFDIDTLKGQSQLDVAVAAPGGDCWQVDDLAPTTGLTWDGTAPASASLASGVLDACGAGVAGGGTLTLSGDTSVAEKTFYGLNVGFSRTMDQDGGLFSYLVSWVGGCDRFGPCDADPSLLAEFHFDVTHGSGDTVLCPGVLTAGDTVTHCDLSGTLAPTYSGFGLAADPLWVRNPLTTAAGLSIVFYETPGGKIASSLDVASFGDYLTWITGLLGPYPYGDEIRYAGGPTVWLGFEHPANIVLQEDLPTVTGAYTNPPQHVTMHETAHQWSGDRTTIATASDFVWKEATVEYLTYVFEDEHRPPAEAAGTLEYWKSISLQAGYYPRPTDNPPVQDFYGDVYGAGPMTLYLQLESILGRAPILAAIQAFLKEPGARSVMDVEAALEASTGKDLSAYFNLWVFGAGVPEWPTFAISTQQTGDQVTVTVTQQNASGKLFGCEVDVEVQGATSSAVASVEFGVAPTSATATATVTLSEPVTGTVLDPNNRLIGNAAMAGGAKAPQKPKRKVWIL